MNPGRSGSFLTRLAKDTRGNTLAIMAAAFFPLAGLIGGSVDMSRIYITKTRLQQACDAGALAGRKVMGAGSWTTVGDTSSRGQAYRLFASNFATGSFGTNTLQREFTEDEGTVTGVTSVNVPMTIMRIFGKQDHLIEVTCTAEMEIPNTDVMFVLDVTNSMAGTRIAGLKSAVKCFYEALLKVATPEPCSPKTPADPAGTSKDPTATAYDGTAQIRLGFVPYAVNVNVGKLLPNAFISNTWNYQSRRPAFTTVYAWTGSTGSTSWTAWPSSSTAPSRSNATDYQNWSDIGTNGGSTITVNSKTLTKRPKTGKNNNTELTSAECSALNASPNGMGTIVTYVDSGNMGSETSTNTVGAPVHPTTTQTYTYRQDDVHTVSSYKYTFNNGNNNDKCRLQSGSKSYTFTRTGSATRTITWTTHQHWNGTSYTYSQQLLDVSALKAGGSNWNNGSVAIAGTVAGQSTGAVNGATVKLSGQTSDTVLKIPGGTTSATWNGCIMERPTWKNTDQDPSDEWDPIKPEALDFVIDHVPSATTPEQAWGPMLQDIVYGRTTNGNGTRTSNTVTSATSTNSAFPRPTTWCPTPSRKLAPYNTVGDLVSYIDSFTTTSLGTYHDIGMLWGARLLSPTGIFADENDMTDNGGAIERHMIFMTDGNAQTVADNLDAYGFHWWDHGETTYAPSATNLDNLVNARLSALCEAVKNMNITLWVISYGGGVNEDNEDRLEDCASPDHFYSADDPDALISRFKQIASDIADLRLTH